MKNRSSFRFIGSTIIIITAVLSICLSLTTIVQADVAQGTINYNAPLQELEGFGGAAVYDTPQVSIHPYRKEVYELLFKDLGLDILRIRNSYGYDNANITATGTIFSEAKERNPNIKTLLTPWSPAPYLKTTDSYKGGTLKKNASGNFIYDDYAQWWADSLTASDGWNSVGVYPDYISIQNEPDYENFNYDTCRFDPTENATVAGYDLAFEAVWQELNYRFGPDMPKMLGPDTAGYSVGEYYYSPRGSRDYIDNLIDQDHCFGFAFHPYSDGYVEGNGNYGYDNPDYLLQSMIDYANDPRYNYKPLFMTEYVKNGMVSGFNEAVNLAWHIHNFLTYMRVTSYCHWTLFRHDPTSEGGMVNLYTPDSYPRHSDYGYIIHDLYWFFKAYAHFTDPGWFVLDCTAQPSDNLRMTAFKNPENNRLTVVILNKSTTAESLTLNLNAYKPFTSQVYRSSASEHWVFLGSFSNPISLPPQSITTISFFARNAAHVIPGAIVDWGATKTNTDLTGLIDVAAGGWHSLGLKIDGSIVAWGRNFFGQSEIPEGSDYVAVAAGENHSLALTADGSVVAWGFNESHQCDVPAPNSDFVAIASGSNHSLALKADGRIIAWGLNNFGQRTLPAGNDFVAIAAGYWHSVALTSGGYVVCWGDNSFGQTIIPESYIPWLFTDIAAGDFHTLAITTGGGILAWGKNDFGQTDVPDGNDFIAVAAGADHSLALTADGSVVAWGSNYDIYGNWAGQAMPPSDLNNVSTIVGGGFHSLALKTDGTVVGWGNNDDGQAVPPTGDDFVSVSVGGLGHTLALRQDGSLVGWGYNSFGQADAPPGNDFIAVAAGGEHSLALKEDGSIVAWGNNDFNQCKISSPNSDFVAIAAGADHCLALKRDGSIIAWGCNDDGQTDVPSGNDFIAIAAGWYHCVALRYDGSIVAWGWDRYGQAETPDGDEFIAIAAGWGHSLALHSAGFIVGWGCNDFGEIDVPESSDFVSIAAGDSFSVALKSDGSLAAWGSNDYGQAEPPQGSNFTAIAAGGRHGVALVPFCKPGAPNDLSASDGDFPDYIHLDWEPVPNAEVYEIWRSPNSDMTPASIIGESIEPSFDDFVSARTTYYYRVRVRNSCGTGIFSPVDSGYVCIPPSTDVSASDGQYSDHIRIDWNTVSEADSYEIWRAVSGGSEPIVNLGSFASPPHDDYNNVTPGLTYYYWVRAVNACGKSSFGLIDKGYVDNSSQSFGVSGGEIYAWGLNEYGQASPPDGNDFIAVSAGWNHSLALKRDGSIVGFGCNTNGAATNPQFYGHANPPAGHNFVTVSAGGFHSLALKSDGSIAGWGWNIYGQASPPDGHDFVAISAGYIHSLALKCDGSIVAWGNNSCGQASPPVGNDFVAVSAGNFHSLALKRDGSIVAWGANYSDLLNTPAGHDFAAISAGYYYNVALKSNGSLVTWGRDASTVMAPPAGNDFMSIAAGFQKSIALTRDGYITAWGYDASGFGFYQAPNCNGFLSISAFGSHYLVITTKPVDMNEPPLDADIDISVAKCTVRAGKDRTQGKDAVSISGFMDATVDDIVAADFIRITVNSDNMPSPLDCNFPINGSTFKKGRFKSSLTDNASKISLAFNTKTLKFSFSAKNVNLSGLSCPIVLTVKIGGSSGSVDIGESITNGKKLVPINLLMGVEDSLRVDLIKLKRGSRPNSDRLSVKGAFSLATDVNMAATSFSATIGGQTFTIPEGVFKPGKGKYTCPMVDLYDSPEFTAAATFDFSKCTFKLTIKNTKINIDPGDTVPFTITFGTFNEETDVFLP
ncbi:MAG: hypothetical protein JW749_00855 [Sedimentisphaerales bacterium]|nr:hypothetical protein [Sedimentisphaerales bacterium]